MVRAGYSSAAKRIVCSAADEEGDALRYTIEVDEEGGAEVIRAERRAASLPPEDLDILDTVTCDAWVVPDGEETTCLATLEGGETRAFVLRRDGGDHRLFPAE